MNKLIPLPALTLLSRILLSNLSVTEKVVLIVNFYEYL